MPGADPAAIASGVKSFRGVEHRLEFVAEIGGVQFYNDSKATNVDAALKAIEAFPGPLIVILGGKDKGSPYTPLREPLRAKARAGDSDRRRCGQNRRGPGATCVAIEHAGTLDRAVEIAMERATPGDVVLLAPACSSFDQFENYEHRGPRIQGTRRQAWKIILRRALWPGKDKRCLAACNPTGSFSASLWRSA